MAPPRPDPGLGGRRGLPPPLLVAARRAERRTTRAARSSDLGPTVAFLAALLVLADGCRRAGLFEALGAAMAVGARGEPRRLLALVFAAAAATTAVLSLDTTVVLLTPVVFATAARLRLSPRPHVYACSHLANSASLLLPVSNLTNLLALQASDLSFLRFAGLMTLPWLAALAVEWIDAPAPSGASSTARAARPSGLRRSRPSRGSRSPCSPLRSSGFVLGSLAGVELGLGRRRRRARARRCSTRPPAREVVRLDRARASSCSCSRSASSCRRRASTGSATAADALVPDGTGLPALLADRRARRDRGEPRQQPAGDADPPARHRGRRAGRRAGDADRRQRRPEPDLLRARWRRCCGGGSCTRTTSRPTSASSRGSGR